MNKKVIKVIIFLVLLFILGVSCGKKDNDKKNETRKQETKVAENKQETKPIKREDQIKQSTKNIIKENTNGVSIKEIKVNNDLGTEKPNDYIVLVHISFDVKNRPKMAKKMLDMYNNEIGARLAKEKDVEEIVIFWQVPFLAEGENIAKANLKRKGDKMYFESTWYNGHIFTE